MNEGRRRRNTWLFIALVPLLGLAMCAAAVAAYGGYTRTLVIGFVVGLALGATLIRWLSRRSGGAAGPMQRLPSKALLGLAFIASTCGGLLAMVSWGGALAFSLMGAFVLLVGVALVVFYQRMLRKRDRQPQLA